MSSEKMERDLSGPLAGLIALVEKLRGPGGCPWDAGQTDDTIKMYLLEEAYEVLDAVENGTATEVCQELGDLLFQILFMARLAEERGEFDLGDVIEGITAKMINRHPHVFGEVEVSGPEEVAENWARIKKLEKGDSASLRSHLQGIPVHLPALLRAHRLQERAMREADEAEDADDCRGRVGRAYEGLMKSLDEGDETKIGEAIGDLYFNLVHLARHWGQNGEHLLRDANNRFIEGLKHNG